MIPIHSVFIILVSIFALIGSLRGWAKEIIVAFSVLLALFIEEVLTGMVPPIHDLWFGLPDMSRFWIRVCVFGLIVIFGYASPSLAGRFGARVVRERLQDILLGFFLGVLNGLLIIGTLWFYLDAASYGVPPEQRYEGPRLDRTGAPVLDENGQPVMTTYYYPEAVGLGGIRPPAEDSPAWNIAPYLPPRLITGTTLFILVGLAFVFVIIVFI